MEAYKRSQRVASRMREELMLLLRGMNDPRLAGAVVTRIELTDDLAFARVLVRRELFEATPAERKTMLRGFESASGRLRQQVGRALGLRHAPELRFLYDEGQDAATRIEELLHEIATEKK